MGEQEGEGEVEGQGEVEIESDEDAEPDHENEGKKEQSLQEVEVVEREEESEGRDSNNDAKDDGYNHVASRLPGMVAVEVTGRPEVPFHPKREVDPSKRPLMDYVQKIQRDVNANMRGVLVDWLVEVAKEYKLVSDTFYFYVAYIDRKYEEIKPPEVEDFCYITDNTYSKEEVVNMEAEILKALKFELGGPIVKTFLSYFCLGILAHHLYAFAFLFAGDS
ncbi:hypothetical protein JHK86_048311 [Glycine max]|nr:hypothetical protein JHK86_048311 [Glycine max]